jgi:hypothetical protein
MGNAFTAAALRVSCTSRSRYQSATEVSVNTSRAGAPFAGLAVVLANGTVSPGSPGSLTLFLNGQSATVEIASDDSTKLSDPNHLFDGLAAGDSIVIPGSDTTNDGAATGTASFSITINSADDT